MARFNHLLDELIDMLPDLVGYDREFVKAMKRVREEAGEGFEFTVIQKQSLLTIARAKLLGWKDEDTDAAKD